MTWHRAASLYLLLCACVLTWASGRKPLEAKPSPYLGSIEMTAPMGWAEQDPEIGPVPLPPVRLDKDRLYLVTTSKPGGTMTRQGPNLAIERLHPTFAKRLAAAIAEARASGLPEAGVFSAYRPPAFGVGGFGDKGCSLHAYGLAVDMKGIGSAGSREARQWHALARRHGVYGPYGPNHGSEYNHMQPTWERSVCRFWQLRDTINKFGPKNLERMYQVAGTMIDNSIATVTGKKATKVKVVKKKRAQRTRVASAKHPRRAVSRHSAIACAGLESARDCSPTTRSNDHANDKMQVLRDRHRPAYGHQAHHRSRYGQRQMGARRGANRQARAGVRQWRPEPREHEILGSFTVRPVRAWH